MHRIWRGRLLTSQTPATTLSWISHVANRGWEPSSGREATLVEKLKTAVLTAFVGGPIAAVALGIVMVIVALIWTEWGVWSTFKWTAGIVFFGTAALTVLSLFADTSPAVSVYCASCGQYVGTKKRFYMPCERCGSNRHTQRDPGAVR